MSLRTVSDLRTYLEGQRISPEKLGKDVKISNMTIRRLLRRPGATGIPEKYHLALDEHVRRAHRGHPELTSAGVPISDETMVSAGFAGLASKLLAAQADPAQNANQDFTPLLAELERSGREVTDLEALESEVKTTLKKGRFDQRFKSHVKTLFSTMRSANTTVAQKAVCIGALLYFVNPFDLIPDTIPVVGYLDDFAVLSLVVAVLANGKLFNAKRGAQDKAV